MATEKEIQKALLVLSAAYPRFDLPDETVSIYCRLLVDLDFDTLKAATLQCATTCKFFPTVAEIRDAAAELKIMAEGIPDPASAWGEVVSQIKAVGSYGVPVFTNPLIADVIHQIGGWRGLCMSENVVADRARFMDTFNDAKKASRRRAQMLPEILDLVDHRLGSGNDPIKLLAAKMDVSK